MYNDTITLFCRYQSQNNGLCWKYTVLHNVDVNTDRARIVSTQGETSSDRCLIHIQYDLNNGAYVVENNNVIEPKQYSGTGISFKSGEDFDFIMLEAYSGTNNIADSTYTDGVYNYFNSAYDNVYAITSMAKYSVIPHYEITAR